MSNYVFTLARFTCVMWDLFCLVPVGGQDYRVPLLFSKRALGFLWVFLALKNSKLAFFVWLCFFFWVGFWQGVWVSEQTPLPILSETPSAKSSRHFFRFRFSYWKVWTRVSRRASRFGRPDCLSFSYYCVVRPYLPMSYFLVWIVVTFVKFFLILFFLVCFFAFGFENFCFCISLEILERCPIDIILSLGCREFFSVCFRKYLFRILFSGFHYFLIFVFFVSCFLKYYFFNNIFCFEFFEIFWNFY